MLRTDLRLLALLGTFASVFAACKSGGDDSTSGSSVSETDPTCMNGARDGNESGVDCGGTCVTACGGAKPGDPIGAQSSSSGGDTPTNEPGVIAGVRDGSETDVDCGGPDAPKCAEGKKCLLDRDCGVACSYAKKCIMEPSCKPRLGGDTCGSGEVGEVGAQNESCCRSLIVPGYTHPAHPGKQVYLDKYEITAGRVRAFVDAIAAANGGKPDVKDWITKHTPQIWDTAWSTFLPSDYEGGTVTIGRRLLGDPRPEDKGEVGPPGPGVILPPDTDQVKHLGINYQFGSEIYVDLHGSDCGTWSGAYGFSTFYYPDDILSRDTQLPRASGVTFNGQPIPAKDLLDVKSMNCISNAMLAAFCAWDGGQLATTEVLDFVTATPPSLGNTSGCGTQYDNHGDLLQNPPDYSRTVQTGGRCPPVLLINATFDAGDNLPVPGSPLNTHNYNYPNTGNPNHDKSWEVASPGRVSEAKGEQTDMVRINPNDEPWMDLSGNLSEAAFDTSGGNFSGLFALKYRGIGYGSARSDLNTTLMKGESILRIQRPEAKAAFTGGRCMRFK